MYNLRMFSLPLFLFSFSLRLPLTYYLLRQPHGRRIPCTVTKRIQLCFHFLFLL